MPSKLVGREIERWKWFQVARSINGTFVELTVSAEDQDSNSRNQCKLHLHNVLRDETPDDELLDQVDKGFEGNT
ncbi:hypothetical protein Leryth_026436 [Lithospermum erythrorhizon]|nr:hypothetical protein Leryth_026436 [Lithospermum erythrorhizon]